MRQKEERSDDEIGGICVDIFEWSVFYFAYCTATITLEITGILNEIKFYQFALCKNLMNKIADERK